MHDIFFRNITSHNKGRRILSSSELTERSGISSRVQRHLVCRVSEVQTADAILPKPTLYVFKKRDRFEKVEIFYCKMKGSMYFALQNKLCLVSFINSLRIQLKPVN